MNRYTIYCTEEQTKKALNLGAPIKEKISYRERCGHLKQYREVIPPTIAQMIGWLEEKIDSIEIIKKCNGEWLYMFFPTSSPKHEYKSNYPSRKEATLAAIDAALDYLINNKK